jgi:lipid-A-disaccharide synthase
MERNKIPVLISAAEGSGDAHAANLVREVRCRRPEVEFEGFGGGLLLAAGCRIHQDLVGISSMALGFLGHLGTYFMVLRRFDRLLREVEPKAVVLVDSPGLNFLLARLARWRGVPVVYYICPQIWAMGPWRRSKILRYTDLLLPILPFEEEVYRNPHVPVKFVGHPLGDALNAFRRDAGLRLRKDAGVRPGETVIGILPGSREREVRDLMPIFRRILDELHLDGASHRVVVSCYRKDFAPPIEAALRGSAVPFHVAAEDAKVTAMASDLVLVKSGTSTLEVAYFERPMLVIYRANAFERCLFRIYAVTPFFSVPNILGASLFGGQPVVPERLCRGDEAKELAGAVLPLLKDGEERERAVGRLRRLKEAYLAPGATARAASALLEFLEGEA